MNSCLYEVELLHCRLEPKVHRFHNRIFMFYLDLDEIDTLSHDLKFLSHNRFNLYQFRDTDHLNFHAYSKSAPTRHSEPRRGEESHHDGILRRPFGPPQDDVARLKENLMEYVKQKGVTSNIKKVMLLTNLRMLGHLFNPVSFYFCFGDNDEPVCLVPEVGNTFGELKPFFLGPETLSDGKFQTRLTKYYYISPFIDLDAELDFQVSLPSETLDIRVNDFKDGKKFFLSTMTGRRRPLSDKNLLGFTFRYPFVTLQVISLIHWQAMRLYLKRVPHHAKEDHPELQRDVQRPFIKKR